jgi:hypothetical protein
VDDSLAGRRTVVAISVATIALAGIDVAGRLVVSDDPLSPVRHLPGLALAVIFAFFWLRRANWARWLGSAYCCLIGSAELATAYLLWRTLAAIGPLDARASVALGWIVLVGVGQVACGVALLALPQVRDYFAGGLGHA